MISARADRRRRYHRPEKWVRPHEVFRRTFSVIVTYPIWNENQEQIWPPAKRGAGSLEPGVTSEVAKNGGLTRHSPFLLSDRASRKILARDDGCRGDGVTQLDEINRAGTDACHWGRLYAVLAIKK
jgi:hypothetical protein